MSTKPSLELTDKFIKGLQKYKLTYDEIKNSNWKYCGGRERSHLNYFKLCFKSIELPPLQPNCVCGHSIKENCYITNNEQILVLGNCCIKKFIEKSSRTCEKCGCSHKNRVVNRCNICRNEKERIKEQNRTQELEEERIQKEQRMKEYQEKRQKELLREKTNFENSICNECEQPFPNQGKYRICFPCRPKCECGNVKDTRFDKCFTCSQQSKKDVCVGCKKLFDGKGKYDTCYYCNKH